MNSISLQTERCREARGRGAGLAAHTGPAAPPASDLFTFLRGSVPTIPAEGIVINSAPQQPGAESSTSARCTQAPGLLSAARGADGERAGGHPGQGNGWQGLTGVPLALSLPVQDIPRCPGSLLGRQSRHGAVCPIPGAIPALPPQEADGEAISLVAFSSAFSFLSSWSSRGSLVFLILHHSHENQRRYFVVGVKAQISHTRVTSRAGALRKPADTKLQQQLQPLPVSQTRKGLGCSLVQFARSLKTFSLEDSQEGSSSALVDPPAPFGGDAEWQR